MGRAEEIIPPSVSVEEAKNKIKQGWQKISKRKLGAICASLGFKAVLHEEFRYMKAKYLNNFKISKGNKYFVLEVYDPQGKMLFKIDQPPYGITTGQALDILRKMVS